MPDLLFAPLASLPLLARGVALAAQGRLANGANSGVRTLSLTPDSSVTAHKCPVLNVPGTRTRERWRAALLQVLRVFPIPAATGAAQRAIVVVLVRPTAAIVGDFRKEPPERDTCRDEDGRGDAHRATGPGVCGQASEAPHPARRVGGRTARRRRRLEAGHRHGVARTGSPGRLVREPPARARRGRRGRGGDCPERAAWLERGARTVVHDLQPARLLPPLELQQRLAGQPWHAADGAARRD